MRAPCFVPETQRIDEVFKTLKNTKNHMAIVVDEYGGTVGIATMEDILEELVGNIMDEYDEEEEAEYDRQIVAIGDNSYIIEGLTELDVVNEEFNINLLLRNTTQSVALSLVISVQSMKTPPFIRI